jgi:hypothetical protein
MLEKPIIIPLCEKVFALDSNNNSGDTGCAATIFLCGVIAALWMLGKLNLGQGNEVDIWGIFSLAFFGLLTLGVVINFLPSTPAQIDDETVGQVEEGESVSEAEHLEAVSESDENFISNQGIDENSRNKLTGSESVVLPPPNIAKFQTDNNLNAAETNMTVSKATQRSQVFISYSHKDQEWLALLQTHLKPFVRNNAIVVWDDTQIKSGTNWKAEIEKALGLAKVAILLVSPNFLASDFIFNHELTPLLEAAKQEGLIILWILIRPCGYKETEIAHYQAAHNPADPLVKAKRAGDLDTLLVAICERVKEAVNRI